jgi:CRISPR/Cas system-associated endonuclease Cas1
MADIVVSDDFVRTLAESGGNIRFLNARGEVLGRFEPELTAEELAEIRRRLASDEPRYTTAQMRERLQAKAAQ